MSHQFSQDVKSLRDYFNTGATKSIAWRKEQLTKLIALIKENSNSIIDAVHSDLHQSKFQAELSEVNLPVQEAEYHLNNVSSWVQPQYVQVDKMFKPGNGFYIYEPLGVVLIIAPWNYPLSLIFKPLVGALSAGNCVVIKPSEVSQNSAKWASTYISKYLDNKAVKVIEGGPEETTQLLKEKFDHIFYTGSTQVGKIVMKAAAEHLTPVTLELGGKSPCVVTSDADLDVSARRIISGKYGNSGQTCVAPDYILVDKQIEDKLIDKLKTTIKQFYTENPQTSSDYARIISARHTQRVSSLIDPSKVVYGGKVDQKDNYIEPTLIKTSRDDTSKLMDEEIFGPLLPVVSYDNIDQAIQYINNKPKPLALYVFSSNKNTQDQVLSSTSSGGVCINDTLFHILDKNLPFGGVGPSGMGSYNGKTTFETFSHKKSVMRRPTWLDPAIRYPPFDEKKIWWFKTLTRTKVPVAAKRLFLALVVLTIAIAGARFFA